MNLEQLFCDCVQREVDQRTKEEIRAAKLHELRCRWCDETLGKISFLKDKGLRIDACKDSEYPYVTIKPSNGWAFVQIVSDHVWKDEDINDETFYVYSNTGSFPPKTRVGWESIMKTISKWL